MYMIYAFISDNKAQFQMASSFCSEVNLTLLHYAAVPSLGNSHCGMARTAGNTFCLGMLSGIYFVVTVYCVWCPPRPLYLLTVVVVTAA